MLDNYLTPNQKQNRMVAHLSLGDKWEAIGEARGKAIGEAHGEARGEARGEHKKARLTVLNGLYMRQTSNFLAILCGLPIKEVLELETGYVAVKKAWQRKKIDMVALTESILLSEQEIKFVISCLDSTAVA